MFLNKRNIISGFLEKKLTSYNANLINTNPAYMKKICKEHPEYIKYARGAAITTELIDIVLNHPDFEKAMLYEALAYYGGISSDTKVMKKLCAIDAGYFSYCKGATLTYEIYEIAYVERILQHYNQTKIEFSNGIVAQGRTFNFR